MSCPWVKIKQCEPRNIENSQGVANLQAKEEKSYSEKMDKISTAEVNINDDIPSKLLEAATDDQCANDVLLAKMFQMQFDEEYEQHCAKRRHGEQPKAISSENYQVMPLNYNIKEDSEEEEIDSENWDTFDIFEKEFAYVPLQRVHKMDKKVKMKQDVRPDMQLSSKVFNSLRTRSYIEGFSKYKAYYDKRKRPVYKLLGIDQYTWRLIREMIKDRTLKKVLDIISFDEDVTTIRAYSGYGSSCLIKIFKATLIPYNKVQITGCQRAEREAASYVRLKAAGFHYQYVIMVKEHVLVMLLPDRPTLSNELMTRYIYYRVFEKVKVMMRKLFVEANLIHANLSEHSVIWYEICRCISFINLSESVDSSHEKAFDFLFRDCTNIVNFFERNGYPDVDKPDDLFKYITGYSFLDKSSHSKLEELVNTKVT